MDQNIIDLCHEPQHLPTLAMWHHEEWAYLNPGKTLHDRIEYMKASLNDKLIPITYFYKQKHKLAGSASLMMHDLPSRREFSPWLASVFVKPDYRNQGLGSELV